MVKNSNSFGYISAIFLNLKNLENLRNLKKSPRPHKKFEKNPEEQKNLEIERNLKKFASEDWRKLF